MAKPTQAALAAFRRGQFREALALAERHPRDPLALEIAAKCQYQLGKKKDAERSLKQLLKLRPKDAANWQNLGVLQAEASRYGQALESFEAAARAKPDHLAALNNISAMALQAGKPDRARQSLFRLKRAHPKVEAIPRALAQHLVKVGDSAQALEVLREAAAASPKSADLQNDIGAVFAQSGEDAAAERHFQKAVQLSPQNVAALENLGSLYVRSGQMELARPRLEVALLAAPQSYAVHYGLGVVASWQGRTEDALTHLRTAIDLQPNAADAHFYLMNTLIERERFEEAEKAGKTALTRVPGNAKLLSACGSLQSELKRKDLALEHWEASLQADPQNDYIRSHVLLAYHEQCDWDRAEPHLAHLDSLGMGAQTTDPFVLLSLDGDPKRTLFRSQKVAEKMQAGLPPRVTAAPPSARPARLRLGFFSADLQTHPVGLLLIDVLERLDTERFDIALFETGSVAKDAVNTRFRAVATEYHPDRARSLSAFAEEARSAQLDVAFDLGGHSKGGRLELFACGVAPIQIAYLGYPASTGATFVDYLLSDAVVTPPDAPDAATEALLLMPGSFMPVGALPNLIETTRAEHGLPEDAFVFASFNKANKMTRDLFATWMRLLSEVPGSVLWLADLKEQANGNLRAYAEAAGVDPARLIFAGRTETTQDHVSRLALADLFLDSFIYGAHSTAVDALSAGLPLLTHCGPGFASRIGASLLTQIGVPELITENRGAYFETALDLANHPDKLKPLRARLHAGLPRLFDPERYARDFEALIEAAYARHLVGDPPSLTKA